MKWISCGEKLPPLGEDVIFYVGAGGSIEVGWRSGLASQYTWVAGEYYWDSSEISHWMPLPEPPL